MSYLLIYKETVLTNFFADCRAAVTARPNTHGHSLSPSVKCFNTPLDISPISKTRLREKNANHNYAKNIMSDKLM